MNKEMAIKRGLINGVFVLLELLVVIAIVFISFSNIFTPNRMFFSQVVGNSMNPTLKSGQITFPEYVEFSEIKRGDIIVAREKIPNSPNNVQVNNENNKNIIKRVIGLPGETIRISNNKIYINGELYYEEYLTDAAAAQTSLNSDAVEYTLEENEMFLIGDNRGNSYDCRYYGPLKLTSYVCKASTVPNKTFWINISYVVLVLLLVFFILRLIEYGESKLMEKYYPEFVDDKKKKKLFAK